LNQSQKKSAAKKCSPQAKPNKLEAKIARNMKKIVTEKFEIGKNILQFKILKIII